MSDVSVTAVCVGELGELTQGERTVPSAFDKRPVAGAVRLTAGGVVGDAIGNTRDHGTPDKAALLYPAVHHDRWAADFGKPIGPGGLGENVTLAGVTEADVCVGDTWRLGSAVVQVTQPRHPCWKIDAHHGVAGLTAAVLGSGATGWYVRVLDDGDVAAGDVAELVERPHAEMSVQRCNDVFLRRNDWQDEWAAIVACEALSREWV